MESCVVAVRWCHSFNVPLQSASVTVSQRYSQPALQSYCLAFTGCYSPSVLQSLDVTVTRCYSHQVLTAIQYSVSITVSYYSHSSVQSVTVTSSRCFHAIWLFGRAADIIFTQAGFNNPALCCVNAIFVLTGCLCLSVRPSVRLSVCL